VAFCIGVLRSDSSCLISKLRIPGTKVAELLKRFILSRAGMREFERNEEKIKRKVETALGKIRSSLKADGRDVEPVKST